MRLEGTTVNETEPKSLGGGAPGAKAVWNLWPPGSYNFEERALESKTEKSVAVD